MDHVGNKVLLIVHDLQIADADLTVKGDRPRTCTLKAEDCVLLESEQLLHVYFL